ncbi:uncharacterized protein G2W53_023210 [Senna tora]|uniref:Uncharacterized protein n=1 Tax=Senna tora TaxID=362788 RepID=A0A834T9P1_9FABA|nr:uncharacterized protein G2W53_023210 [Senna tora]
MGGRGSAISHRLCVGCARVIRFLCDSASSSSNTNAIASTFDFFTLTVAADSKSKKSFSCIVIPAAALLCVFMFVTTSFLAQGYREKLSTWRVHDAIQNLGIDKCKNQCRPRGSEALPEGIVSNTSDLKMRPLGESIRKKRHDIDTFNPIKPNVSTNLLAVTVGIRQKDLVSKMIQKVLQSILHSLLFLASDFVVMLFHYDGIVDQWKDFEWSDNVIHVSAINQSKWWFAKRFLHPDIVAEYGYIFLWDEDLGVEYFQPDKYVSIIKSEGLEISQPALDPKESAEVHHQITLRGRRSGVHRRTYKAAAGSGKGCDDSSTAPPCTGWIEMMAPVFSRDAWRCVWYMIQGERTKNVGVVDSEYIVHHGLPTLGGVDNNTQVSSQARENRVDVRRLSYHELDVFKKRWKMAAEQDECWVDPYK